MTDQDYLNLFDSADELAAVESIAETVKQRDYDLEDSLLDEINAIEQNLETEKLADDFQEKAAFLDTNTVISALQSRLEKLKHQHQIQHQQFEKLRKLAAPHWQPTSKH
jgi:membrane-bound lytic murein transglycosylase MltF